MSGNTNGNFNDTDVDIEIMVTFARQVFEVAQQIVEDMIDGDRIQVKQLVQLIAESLSKDEKDVLGFVDYFVHNTRIAYLTRGKNGGLVKGIKPAKKTNVSNKNSSVGESLNS